MKARTTEIKVHHPREARPVSIVADAAISTRGLHGGRLVPLVLLDTTDRPDIAEFIRIHEAFAPGDVKFQWGQIERHEGTVALYLTFIRPMELFMVLEFNIVQQGILVEQALIGQGIYIARAERADDRWVKNVGRPKVLVEIGDTGFRRIWDDLFHKDLTKHFRDEGMSRRDSRCAARSLVEELRKVGSLRMRDLHD